MEHGTQQPDPPNSPIQIHADRIVTLAASHLAEQATTPHPIGGHPADRCMNQNLLDDAIRRAQETVLPAVRPHASHDLGRAAARAMLLPPAGTVGEYADRLAEMAVSG